MKILWFANTPCGAREVLDEKNVGGGWLTALEELIVEDEDLDLHIAFYWKEKKELFKYKKTTYHPVVRDGMGSKIHGYINRVFNINADEKEIARLYKVVKEVQPDVIHIHGTEDNFGLIQELTKIPSVVSIQGLLSSISLKVFSGIPENIVYKNETFISKVLKNSTRFTQNKMSIKAVRERKVLSLSKHIIGRTDWDKRITKLLSVDAKYSIVQELMRSSFYQKEWNKNKFGNKVKIVTILGGGLYKGFETIVSTARILKENASFDFEWDVIGINELSLSAKIVKNWYNCSYSDYNIHLAGLKEEQEIVDVLVDADIYCQMSHIENSPNSLCEAMLVGMPCIASFVGGTDTILENRKEGLLVQEGDPYSYAGALFDFYNNFNMAKEYGMNARKKACERHDKIKLRNNLIDIYRDWSK